MYDIINANIVEEVLLMKRCSLCGRKYQMKNIVLD